MAGLISFYKLVIENNFNQFPEFVRKIFSVASIKPFFNLPMIKSNNQAKVNTVGTNIYYFFSSAA